MVLKEPEKPDHLPERFENVIKMLTYGLIKINPGAKNVGFFNISMGILFSRYMPNTMPVRKFNRSIGLIVDRHFPFGHENIV